MKAAVADRYGPPKVVRVSEVDTPSIRGGEVLVRVAAVAVTAADSRIRAARFPQGFGPFARLAFGVVRPRRKILGSAFSGVVEAVGPKVTEFSVGDEVAGMAGIGMGAHAEYLAVQAKKIVHKPATVTHDDAAAILFGGSTALHYLRDKVTVKPGDSVLVNGASGAIGTNAVQLAKFFGANVTGVTSTPNAELVTKLGADRVIDYQANAVVELTDRFDVVLDTVGNISPSSGKKLLTAEGSLLLAVANLWETVRARGNVKAGPSPEKAEAFAFLLDLAANDHLVAVIDKVLTLDDIVEAHERVDSGRKVGNIIIRP
ncbi:NAD(P)-dependent alcohol dehydrogenase [Nocardia pneumoniae]|uniref:NAD(P)-dependent alcohol dehydrogenase n=1 Tax=Nocardia pneumoniae TaxID=228601 RepID=UPI00030A1F9D|nr:NAD(P)-dependent alcohol dehydrogenase [Nocardia pneumoniae]